MKKVKILNQSHNEIPTYATEGSAGVDLRADIVKNIRIDSLCRKIIPTGIYLEIPEGYEAQIRPRSGLALKEGLFVLNTPGTIDSDYRGEISVIVANFSDSTQTIKPGEKIAQMVFNKVEKVKFVQVEKLGQTRRGKGGFGSTGK